MLGPCGPALTVPSPPLTTARRLPQRGGRLSERHVGTAEPAPQVALAPSALSPQTQDLEPAEDGLPPGQPGPGVSHPSQPHPEMSGVLCFSEAVAWGQMSKQVGCESPPPGKAAGSGWSEAMAAALQKPRREQQGSCGHRRLDRGTLVSRASSRCAWQARGVDESRAGQRGGAF